MANTEERLEYAGPLTESQFFALGKMIELHGVAAITRAAFVWNEQERIARDKRPQLGAPIGR